MCLLSSSFCRLDGAREDLADLVIVHEMREIQDLVSAHNQFKATIGDADTEFRNITGIEQVLIYAQRMRFEKMQLRLDLQGQRKRYRV